MKENLLRLWDFIREGIGFFACSMLRKLEELATFPKIEVLKNVEKLVSACEGAFQEKQLSVLNKFIAGYEAACRELTLRDRDITAITEADAQAFQKKVGTAFDAIEVFDDYFGADFKQTWVEVGAKPKKVNERIKRHAYSG